MAVDMKQMISNTMAGLLEHKSVDKITVKELVEACGISRQAFYYHFQDIMDVIEWAMAQALQEAVDVSLAAPTPQEALETVILSLRKNKRMIQHLMSSQRRSEIERLLVQAMDAYLAKMLRAKAVSPVGKPDDIEIAIHFYSYGLVGMLVENLDSERPARVLAGQLCDLLTGAFWNGRSPL